MVFAAMARRVLSGTFDVDSFEDMVHGASCGPGGDVYASLELDPAAADEDDVVDDGDDVAHLRASYMAAAML